MKRITRFKKRTWVLLGVVAVIAAMASVGAYAYWTTGGTGTGSATATTTTDITVNQNNSVTNLYPGGPAQGLSGNFTNPNGFTVNINSVTAAVTGVTGAGNDPGQPPCTTADFATGGSFGPYVVPAGPGAVGAS